MKQSIPKQLKADRKVSSFIQDQDGNDVLLVYNDLDRVEFIDRYNNYPGVVTALWIVSIISVVSLSALLYF